MFKTKLIGLAGAAMTFSGMAFGQLCATGTSATAPSLAVTGTNNIRQEGLTELLPALNVTCAYQGAGTATFNLQVQITTTPITSAVTSASSGKTEIALTGSAGTTLNGTYFATVSNNVATFTGVSANLNGTGGVDTFTISYVRVNASVLGSSGAFPTPITAQSFISGTTNSNSGISNSTTVAYAQNALTAQSKVYQYITSTAPSGTGTGTAGPTGVGPSGVASVGAINASSNPGYLVCNGQNSNSNNQVGASFVVQVVEGFSGAFKTAADEAGPGSATTTTGTRIKLVFNNVPTGLNIYVPLSATVLSTVSGPAGNLTVTPSTLTALLTGSETGTFSAPTAVSGSGFTGLNLGQLTVSGTTATAIYEIRADNTTAIDTLEIPVTLGASGNTITNYLTNPTLTVTTSLAPQSATASQIPSFSSTAPDIATVNTVKFTPCQTNLLFPFVTNANGFETGIAISNTTKDPFGTTTQSGTCTLNYYASGVSGATNPTAVTAPNLAEGTNQPYLAGETYAFTLTQSLGVNTTNPATFQGYIIAQCNFIDAHAFAYILGGLQPGMFVNPNNTAMGYLALVVGRNGSIFETLSN